MSSRSSATVSKPVSIARSSSTSGSCLLLDLLDLHVKARRTPRELRAAVVAGEGQLQRAALAGACAEQPLLEALDQVARPELDQLVAPFPALEGLVLAALADQRAGVVEHHEVPLLRRALRGLQARETIAQLVDLLLDLLVCDIGLGPADLQPLVLAQLRLREHPDLEGELQIAAARRQVAE